jgi:TMEM175 potassium channel family protein
MIEADLRPERGRLAVFSDVVIAAVIVVMASSLRTAVPNEPGMLADWAAAAPRFAAFALGFFTLVVVWVNHAYLTNAIERTSRATMWLNAHLLLWISLFPVAVAALDGPAPLATGALVYGVVLTGMAVAVFALRAYVRSSHPDSSAMAAVSEMSTYRSAAAMLICAGSVPLSVLSPYVSVACFVAAPAIFLIPETRPAKA